MPLLWSQHQDFSLCHCPSCLSCCPSIPSNPSQWVCSDQDSHNPDEDHDTGNSVFLIHVLTQLLTSRAVVVLSLGRLLLPVVLGSTSGSPVRQLPELQIHSRWTSSSPLNCTSSSSFPLFTGLVHAVTSECSITKLRRLLVCRSFVVNVTGIHEVCVASCAGVEVAVAVPSWHLLLPCQSCWVKSASLHCNLSSQILRCRLCRRTWLVGPTSSF